MVIFFSKLKDYGGKQMFKIIVDGETVETVMYEDEGDLKKYIDEEYHSYGIKTRYERL